MNVARVVVNDDEEVPELVIADISKAEGQSGTTVYDFKVGLSRETAVKLNVDYTIGKAGDTATLDDDYTVPDSKRKLIFPAGSNTTTMQSIMINVVGDALYEFEEQFSITLSLPPDETNVDLPRNPTMTGTIRNDDDQPTVTIADSSGKEGNGNSDGSVEFTVTLSAAAGVRVKVNYATSDDTATDGTTTPNDDTDDDYVAVPNGTVFIAATDNNSQTPNLSNTFTIDTKADGIDEIDETFEVALSFLPDANATAGAKTKATGTILSDDGPMLNIVNTNTNGAVAEGGNATFEVTLAAPPADDVTVIGPQPMVPQCNQMIILLIQIL